MRLFNPMEATASSTARGTAASSTFSFDNDEDDTAFPPPPSRPITSAPDPPRNASTISSNLHDVLWKLLRITTLAVSPRMLIVNFSN